MIGNNFVRPKIIIVCLNNSAFPWQADGAKGEVAMNYVIKNKDNNWDAFRLYTFKKFENEVYYRDVVLETDENIKFSLAEFLWLTEF